MEYRFLDFLWLWLPKPVITPPADHHDLFSLSQLKPRSPFHLPSSQQPPCQVCFRVIDRTTGSDSMDMLLFWEHPVPYTQGISGPLGAQHDSHTLHLVSSDQVSWPLT